MDPNEYIRYNNSKFIISRFCLVLMSSLLLTSSKLPSPRPTPNSKVTQDSIPPSATVIFCCLTVGCRVVWILETSAMPAKRKARKPRELSRLSLLRRNTTSSELTSIELRIATFAQKRFEFFNKPLHIFTYLKKKSPYRSGLRTRCNVETAVWFVTRSASRVVSRRVVAVRRISRHWHTKPTRSKVALSRETRGQRYHSQVVKRTFRYWTRSTNLPNTNRITLEYAFDCIRRVESRRGVS